MLTPFAVAFPLLVAIFGVVNAEVALSGAVAAFGAVAWLKFSAAHLTNSWQNSLDLFQQITLSRKPTGRISIYELSKRNDLIDARQPENPNGRRNVVRSYISRLHSMFFKPFTKRIYQSFRANDCYDWKDAASYGFQVNATIAIEDATYKCRDHVPVDCRHGGYFALAWNNAKRGEIISHRLRADGSSDVPKPSVVYAGADGVTGAQLVSELGDMRPILVGKAKHYSAAGVATIGHKKAEPVGFAVGIYREKKCLVN